MMVLVLSACPQGLRGYVTRWMLEISAGVFVGRVSKRVRELLWEKSVSMVGSGRAIMVTRARNEQGLEFRVHGHHWQPVDFEGLSLMMRPADGIHPPRANADGTTAKPPKTGWSKASQRKKHSSPL